MNAISPVPRPQSTPASAVLPSYDARGLVKDGVQANIILDGQVYTLRITRAGKLILTK